MAEDLTLVRGTKKEQYEALIPQIAALLKGEADLTANLANTVAALKEQFDPLWVGFYLVKDHELVLGPFQGPVACTRIGHGKGVCGTAWATGETQLVPDVDRFPGHIACSSRSRSEIVLPIVRGTRVVAVLDIDSAELNAFDEIDAHYLDQIVELIAFE